MLAFYLQRMHLTPRLAGNLNPNGSPPSSRLSSLSPPQQFPWHRRQEIVCISKRHSKTQMHFSQSEVIVGRRDVNLKYNISSSHVNLF